MTFQQLTYFIMVGQYKHFGKAAKALYVAQPTLSTSISSLETELGTTLFRRENRQISLTPVGQVFFNEATEIVERLNHAIQRIKAIDSGSAGSLTIGVLGGLSKGGFPNFVSSFKRNNPNVFVSIKQSNVTLMNRDLIMGSIDIALTRDICIANLPDGITSIKLYRDPFMLFMKKDHPLAYKEHIELSEVSEAPFITLDQNASSDMYSHILKMCAKRGFLPKVDHYASTLEVASTLLKAGLGIAILPECSMVYGEDQLCCRPIEGDDAESDVVLAWNTNNANSAAQIFIDEMDGKYENQ